MHHIQLGIGLAINLFVQIWGQVHFRKPVCVRTLYWCVFRSSRTSCSRPSSPLSLSLSLNLNLSRKRPVSSAPSKMCLLIKWFLHHRSAPAHLLSFPQCCSRRQCSSKLRLQVRRSVLCNVVMRNRRTLDTPWSISLVTICFLLF